MKVLEKLKGLLGTRESPAPVESAEPEPDDDAASEEQTVPARSTPEWMEDYERVEVDRRATIIETHYEAIGPDEAGRIADILDRALTSDGGYKTWEVQQEIEDELGLSTRLVDRLVETEIASIEVLNKVERLYERGEDDELFIWDGPRDERNHPLCEDVRDEIDRRGGVTLDELSTLMLEMATEYEAHGATPQRLDHWSPHEKCRFSVKRYHEF